MELVINSCYGGFSISHEAVLEYCARAKLNVIWKEDRYFYYYGIVPDLPKEGDVLDLNNPPNGKMFYPANDIERNDPILVQVVKDMGEKANGECAELSIVEIPNGVEWEIEEYDGMEHIAEQHRTWG